jgi:hypothetical protein
VRIQSLGLAALSLLLATGCTSHRQYRGTAAPIPPILVSDLETRRDVDDGHSSKACSELLFRERSIEKLRTPEGEVFTLGVIELSDDGHVKDIRQRDEVFRELKRVARGGNAASPASPGAVVVTFVHGWHHRAKVCDENLSCYRRVLEGLVERKDDRANKGPVFGIYIGWRGESARRLSGTTFYNRKATAHHVGSLGGRDLLLQLGEIQRDLDREVRDASGGDRYVNMVTVGHSFGGALVYSAMESLGVSEYGDNKHGVGYPACKDGSKPVRTGVGDLVVLVNPAFEAKRYRYFAEDVEAPGSYSPGQRPVLLTVASEADRAVGVAFPLGRALWLAWHPAYWGSGRSEITGLGHYAPYTTHRLVFNGPAAKPDEQQPLRDQEALKRCGLVEEEEKGLVRAQCDCSYPVYKLTPSGGGGALMPGKSRNPDQLMAGEGSVRALNAADVTLQPVKGENRHLPYIVASAPANLISGHNDIYNPNFILFLIGYINNSLPGPGPGKPVDDSIPECR